MFYNAGNTAVTIKAPRIVNRSGQNQTLTFNTCNDAPSLVAGRGCFIADYSTDGTVAYACRAVVAPSAANVRGSIFTHNAAAEPVSILELR